MAAVESYWVVLDRQGAQVRASASKPAGFSEVLGPYATKQEAQQVANTLNQKAVPNPTVTTVLEQDVRTEFSKLTGIEKVAHWLGDIVLHITDGHMWLSIGWLVLGAILVWIGIITWLQLPQKAAKVGALVAKVA